MCFSSLNCRPNNVSVPLKFTCVFDTKVHIWFAFLLFSATTFLSWFSLVALFLTAKKQEKLEVDFLFLLFPMGYLKVKVIDLSHFPGLLSLFTFAFVYATLFLLLPLFLLISRHSCIAPSISFFKKQLENNDALDFSQFK